MQMCIRDSQRSASLMMLKAFYSVAGAGNVEKLMIDFSIGRGFFVEARGNFVLNQDCLLYTSRCV